MLVEDVQMHGEQPTRLSWYELRTCAYCIQDGNRDTTRSARQQASRKGTRPRTLLQARFRRPQVGIRWEN